MLGNKLINTNAGGGCTNTVDLYNPFPDGGGVALYQLNGDATDESGNYDATTVNAITWGGAGEFGTSAAFNGTSSYIQASTSPLSGFSSTSNYSVSLWFKANSLSSTSTLISGITGTNTLPPYIWVDSTKIVFHGYQYGSYTATINTGQWYNVVMVNSGTTTKAYINGSEVTLSGLTNWNQNAGGILEIGGLQQYGEVLDGSIDQVRIFSRALRPYEVEALYTEEYCTPTIVPSEHFNTVVYSGNASTNPITSVGFQPDFTWIKCRTVNGESHWLTDSVRGAQKSLSSNQAIVEQNITNGLVSFDPNGFTLGSYTAFNSTSGGADNMVAWNFKAGGAAVTNTDGTITSQVSANTEAGFSIVSWTGNNLANATIGHGLEDTPKVTIIKKRTSNVFALGWQINLDSSITGSEGYLNFDTSAMYTTFPNYYTSANSTVLSTNGTDIYERQYNNQLENYIAYCFAEVEGFSNFGSYVGTGASGKTIVTGFEPAFVMIKGTSSGIPSSQSHWVMKDNKRDTTNPNSANLYANLSNQEDIISSVDVNFLENGFEIAGTYNGINQSGETYIYMAFAADPTTIEPSLEDSFNTVLYTGNGGTQSVTGVGFEPGFVWIKDRDASYSHSLQDIVRGAGQNFNLYSDATNVEGSLGIVGYLSSFDTDGFSVSAGSSGAQHTNYLGDNYVAWAWKGAELPAINSNGSIPSVVSANPAAGFSLSLIHI